MKTATLTSQVPAAGLLRRVAAYLIDCGCAFLIFVVTQILLFAPLRELLGVDEAWFRNGYNTELYTLLTISVPVWLYFALTESSPWQASLGKRVAGLQVIEVRSHRRISLAASLGRTIVKLIPWELAHLGNNLPEPVWYAEDPGFRISFLFSGLLLFVYTLSIVLSKTGQGPHDRLSNTMVILAGCREPPERNE